MAIPRIVVARNWQELNDLLFTDSWNRNLDRFRSNCAFRGHSDWARDLQTGLMRLGGNYGRLERNLLRNFRKYASQVGVPDDSIWSWLTLAQHHGLPTRLIDWTYSPYVALHFATDEPALFDRDGIIWCLDYVYSKRLLPANLSGMLREEDSQVFTVEMLTAAASSLEEFDGLAGDPFVVFFEPPSIDDRVINQYALFSVLSDPTIGLDYWLSDKPELYRQIVIPASLKWEVRDKLDQANITERVLFPGLDGLSRWLRRYYGPKVTPEQARVELLSSEKYAVAPSAAPPAKSSKGSDRSEARTAPPTTPNSGRNSRASRRSHRAA